MNISCNLLSTVLEMKNRMIVWVLIVSPLITWLTGSCILVQLPRIMSIVLLIASPEKDQNWAVFGEETWEGPMIGSGNL